MYEYALWVALLAVIFFIFYITRKDLRRKMLWSGLIAAPFGVGELYFIPNYWTPQTFFDWGMRYGLDIEAFILMFFLGGIAGAIYEGWCKKKIPVKQHMCHPMCTCYLGIVVTLTVFLLLVRLTNWNIIYPSIYACLAGGAFGFFRYKHLRKHVLFGGITFMLIYLISLAVMDIFFLPWITTTWLMKELSGILIIGVPIEELFFGFAFGTLWTPLYEEVCSNLRIK